MKYLVTVMRSNGYRCGCCRQEWEQFEEYEYDSDQEAIECAKLTFNDDEDRGMLQNLYRVEKLI